jgi:hypothetical protein
MKVGMNSLSERLAASQDEHWSTKLVKLIFHLHCVMTREQRGAVQMIIRRTAALKHFEQRSLKLKLPVSVCPNCRGGHS